MKLRLILLLFLTLSMILLIVTLSKKLQPLQNKYLEKVRCSKIQKICAKKHIRKRTKYIPQRSLELGQESINNILLKDPIDFGTNDTNLLLTPTLIKVVNIVNHLKDDAVLRITAYTDEIGTAGHNLDLSQKRADSLKKYFINKTSLAGVVAIGYGEALPLTNRRIEVNLKRIKK